MVQRQINLGEISLKLMSGQNFANAGKTDGQTDRPTDGRTANMRHNVIRPKVTSGVYKSTKVSHKEIQDQHIQPEPDFIDNEHTIL